MTKKEKEKLEQLLDWKRETGRLPIPVPLFNSKVSETCLLREYNEKQWELEVHTLPDEKNEFQRMQVRFKHESLIALALLIMDAIDYVNKR
jgi:hypothetical protein